VKYAKGNAKTYMSRFEADTALNVYKILIARKRKKFQIKFDFLELIEFLSLADVPGATHADDVYAYFSTIYSPAISIPSIEFQIITTMVNLIADFATNLQSPPYDGQWTPVGKNDVIPNVLNINNQGLSIIPFPEYNNINVYNQVFKDENVDLI
jgi:hypothetical protein